MMKDVAKITIFRSFDSMQQILEQITSLYSNKFNSEPVNIEKVPQSGSDRLYYRVTGPTTCIATVSKNIKENQNLSGYVR